MEASTLGVATSRLPTPHFDAIGQLACEICLLLLLVRQPRRALGKLRRADGRSGEGRSEQRYEPRMSFSRRAGSTPTQMWS